MSLSVGIIGLPNVGKSTLFNALTRKQQAAAENYPFCTIEPNTAVVEVADRRLDELAKIVRPQQIVRATVGFTDIAGLVKGASKGEGLGNKFLEHIRQVDAIAHVVRCFEDENITHVADTIDPLRDIDTIQTELCLADLDVVDKRLAKVAKLLKSGSKEAKLESEILERVKNFLDEAKPARGLNLTEDELAVVRDANLLTLKPTLYIANVAEDDLAQGNSYVEKVRALAAAEDAQVVVICAKVESEIAELDADEAQEFLADLGLESSGLDRLIHAAFDLLGLMTFLTAGPDECRAWTIKKGTPAVKAAGKIHSDIERGFIRAEIVNYDDLVKLGSVTAARDKGLVRLEGKDYIMQDGDVTYFRFNV